MKAGLYNKPLYNSTLYHTFPEFLEGISQAYGDRAAISWFTRQKEEQCLTYRQVTERVYALREALCAQGLAGKRVAIAGENAPPVGRPGGLFVQNISAHLPASAS